MKTFLTFAALLLLTGCLGNSSAGNDLIGQVKKVQHITPLVFADYYRADVSLGIMRDGVGSMSKEDMVLYIPNPDDQAVLTSAAETGKLVRITYNDARFRWYVENEYVIHAEIAPDADTAHDHQND